jgi:two-component system, NarL family, sensor kinase
VISSESTPRRSGRRITVRAAVAAFVVVDLAAVLVIALGLSVLVGRSTTTSAIRDAQDLTIAEGRSVVWPLLTDAVVGGNPSALAALDRTVRTRVLSDRIVRVKIWSSGGTVLYSDARALIGEHFALGANELRALHTGRSAANVSDLAEPENLYERHFNKLLQVYDGLRAPSGQPLLFEAYVTFTSVGADSHRALVSLLPVTLAGLGLLFLVQVPMAWAMARRLESGRVEEQRLHHHALNSAETERRHIAADLHDGPVQSLAGTALSLAAAAEQAKRTAPAEVGTLVSIAAGDVRQSIRDLRTLIVAIAPPRLHDEGLAAALEDLVSPLRARGVEIRLRVDDNLELSRPVEALAYRTAQEAIRNINRHAPAARRVTVEGARRDDWFVLQIGDDGPGFDPESLITLQADGHMGIRLLTGLAHDTGGSLSLGSDGESGAHLRLELPV